MNKRPNDNTMSPIIVIGLTAQGLALLRLLTKAGYQVVAFSDSKNAVGMRSKYGRKVVFSSVLDLRNKITLLAKEAADPLKCIVASGEMLALILEEFPELYDMCDVESGPFDVVSMLSRKHSMYDFARVRGLPCADYQVLADHEPGSLGYPVILKKNCESFPLFKVVKVDSQEIFEKIVGEIPASYRNDVIVQRYVELDKSKFITFQCYVSNSRRYCEFVAFQRRRTATGLTCFLEEMKPSSLYDDIIELSDKLLSGLDYKGFIEIEYGVDSAGKVYFMETNARVCGTFSALCAKYPSLSDLFVHDRSALSSDYNFGRRNDHIRWVNLARDLKVRLSDKDFRTLAQAFGAAKDVFDWRDPMPFIMQFIR